jgi:hypothetical protein
MKLSPRNNNRRYVRKTRMVPLILALLAATSLCPVWTVYAADGDVVWATSAGGPGRDFGKGIAALSGGTTVVTGRFQHTATFGATTLTAAAPGSIDIFVAKYAASGAVEWAKSAGGAELDEGNGIAALPNGSALVTGGFIGTATFDSTPITSAGVDDVFVAKYDSEGMLVWAKRAGGGNFDVGHGIAALSDGGAIVTGQFQSNPATFGEKTLAAPTAFPEIFVVRYDSWGDVVWAKQAGGDGSDAGFAVSTASDDTAVVTGYFEGMATFGAGEPKETTLTAAGPRDVFVAKYSAGGLLEWVTQAGSTGLDEGSGIAALDDGGALVSWYSRDTAGDPADLFVARCDPDDGSLAWVTQAGGAGSDAAAYGIAALSDGSAVVTGHFEGTATFGAGELNETVLSSPDSLAVLVAQYYPDGTLAWATKAGGAGEDEGLAIAALPEGNAFVTGDFQGPATFDGIPLPSLGLLDVFVAEYEATPGGPLQVEIDIRPGADPNVINLGSHGVIPIAILSSADFDATEVDPGTIELSGATVAIRGQGNRLMAHEEDVKEDGLLDLVMQVETDNLDPDAFQDGQARLTGETYDGVAIEGWGDITIVPAE